MFYENVWIPVPKWIPSKMLSLPLPVIDMDQLEINYILRHNLGYKQKIIQFCL